MLQNHHTYRVALSSTACDTMLQKTGLVKFLGLSVQTPAGWLVKVVSIDSDGDDNDSKDDGLMMMINTMMMIILDNNHSKKYSYKRNNKRKQWINSLWQKERSKPHPDLTIKVHVEEKKEVFKWAACEANGRQWKSFCNTLKRDTTLTHLWQFWR